MVKACIITGFGINADVELKRAFNMVGANAELTHVNDLISNPARLNDYQILGFPGGFSFGDHIGSGKVFGSLFKQKLSGSMNKFIESGKLVIGICNGFQVLVKMGILPNLHSDWSQEVSLIHNDSGKFEDRWVKVAFNPLSPCVWTKNLSQMDLPVRHGEGKFIIGSEGTEERILKENLVAITYTSRNGKPVAYPDNPNGSVHNIAGICDLTGRVFGLMPHPEAFLIPENHPLWSNQNIETARGLEIFKNSVDYFR
ncbi:MAG: phosphoribosylformylglycinamidine synthase subunit PurQ [Spirochaetales bacterium]|nr:phosphoribosylformylglycinamidine synthase subunit PurQ [Spirochaetales bacterium]